MNFIYPMSRKVANASLYRLFSGNCRRIKSSPADFSPGVFLIIFISFMVFFLSGCLEIVEVAQPERAGRLTTVEYDVTLSSNEEEAARGSTRFGAIKLPEGFSVTGAYWGSTLLDDDSARAALVESDYPSGPGYYWWTGSLSGDSTCGSFVVTVSLAVGDTSGDFQIDYRVGYDDGCMVYNDAELGVPLQVINDRDGDLISDEWEDSYPCMMGDTADGDLDPDGDLLANSLEYASSAHPCQSDTDGDGMPDGWEHSYSCVALLVGDSLADPDADLVLNLEEWLISSDPCAQNDSDGDGLPDVWEDTHGCMASGTADAQMDYDGDGASNSIEYGASTDPCLFEDRDGDGASDYWEDLYPCVDGDSSDSGGDYDSDGLSNLEEFQKLSNPCLSDTDADGLPDAWEAAYPCMMIGQADCGSDYDSDNLDNLEEYGFSTDPCNPDTDGDGMDDNFESTHPCIDAVAFDSQYSPDLDVLSSLDEYNLGLDPCEWNHPVWDGPHEVWEGRPAGEGADMFPMMDVDRDDDYNFHAAWIMNGNSVYPEAPHEIYYAFRDESGWTEPEMIAACSTAPVDNVRIAAGGDGAVHVMWYEVGYRSRFATRVGGQWVQQITPQEQRFCMGLEAARDGTVYALCEDGIYSRLYAWQNDSWSEVSGKSWRLDGSYQEGLCGVTDLAEGPDGKIHISHNQTDGYTYSLSHYIYTPGGGWDEETVDYNTWEGAGERIYSGCEFGQTRIRVNNQGEPIVFGVLEAHFTDPYTPNQHFAEVHMYEEGEWRSVRNFCSGSSPCLDESNMPTLYDFGLIDGHFGYGAASWNDNSGEAGMTRVFPAATLGSEPLPPQDASGLKYGKPILTYSGMYLVGRKNNEIVEYYYALNGDRDADGIRDHWENLHGCLNADSADSDLDPDADGLASLEEYEYSLYMDPCDPDTDGDTMDDGWEVYYSCLDATVDDGDENEDGDYCPNIVEYGNSTDPCTPEDSDGDGMCDVWEDSHYCLDYLVPDSALDQDGDSLASLYEFYADTDPCDPDTDDDGIGDAWEVAYSACGVDPLEADTLADDDADGFTNMEELLEGTSPCMADTDMEGLLDGDEVILFSTNPLDPDTDGDGMDDAFEVANDVCLDPLGADTVLDPDADGLNNMAEYVHSSAPCSDDTDGDLMPDGWEDAHESCGLDLLVGDSAMDNDLDGLANLAEYNHSTDACEPDSDGDGLEDGAEVDTYGTVPTNPDTDSDGLGDGDEISVHGTSALAWDSDGDAMPDPFEVANATGHSQNLDAMDPDDGMAADFDGDGNSNSHEYWNGSDPWSPEPAGAAGCYFWGEAGDKAAADGVVSPLDLSALSQRVALKSVSYEGVLPPNGDTQEMDMDGAVSPLDISLLKQMVSMQTVSSVPARPVDLVVIGQDSVTAAVGSTAGLTVAVLNEDSTFSAGFGVVFEIDGDSSSGSATILGGEGQSGGGRYDVSWTMASGGRSSVVLRVDSPGTILIDVSLPQCGNDGKGRYHDPIYKKRIFTVKGE